MIEHVPDTGPDAGDKEINLERSLGRSTGLLVVVVTVIEEEENSGLLRKK